MNSPVFQIFQEWEESGRMTEDDAKYVALDFDLFMDRRLSEFEETLDADPLQAFSQLAILSSFISAVALKRPSVLRKLEKWIRMFKDMAKRLAITLGADALEIAVGGWVPTVSVSLSFEIERDDD